MLLADFDDFPAVMSGTDPDEQLDVRANFDVDHYLETSKGDFIVNRPIEHYLEIGWLEGFDPCRWFSVKGYLANNPDVAASGVEPFGHYLRIGRIEGRSWTSQQDSIYEVVGKHFSAGHYKKSYHDLEPGRISLLEHYIVFGWKEGRAPASWFSSKAYLVLYPDVDEAGIEPFYHYLTRGAQEGREIFADDGLEGPRGERGSPEPTEYHDVFSEFDADFYRSNYPDITGPNTACFDHYVCFGWKEGRNPAAWFSTDMYRDAYGDLLGDGENPFVHYIRSGRAQDLLVYPAVSKGGLRLRVDREATLVVDDELKAFSSIDFEPAVHARGSFSSRSLDIHWVIPDFSGFSGGHSTIFQIARWLEFSGHRLTFWIVELVEHDTAESVYDDVSTKFQTLRADFRVCDGDLGGLTGDAIFATGWQTVPVVSRATGFLGRFYLVQDFEPYFFPVGSKSIAAGFGYDVDFGCICASRWLANKLRSDHGRWTSVFELAVDKAAYHLPPEPRSALHPGPLRIAVYARSSTPRRCVDVIFLALEKLAGSNIDFEVILFASDNKKARAPFPCTVHSYLRPEELGELYRTCDIGISFSATNYSLVPQEMMACGLPVVELASESSKAIFPRGVVTLTGPSPLKIASDLEFLLRHPEARERQRRSASRWVADLDWGRTARQVARGITERLLDLGHAAEDIGPTPGDEAPKASVCIPTFNGGDELLEVLDAVRKQVTPWPFEIVVVDSSSTDGTPALLATMGDVKLRTIAQADFGHGKTRNLCISDSTGEFIAILTQDAKPMNSDWLYNLVTALERHPRAAGAFGRHVAKPGSSPLTKMELAAHFDTFADLPVAMSADTDRIRWEDDVAWKQLLHFYSDNNSCMRRSVWTQIPYPDVEYGEDQVWASQIIAAGYERVYVHLAVVYHSHEYDARETYKRCFTEGGFFKQHFGYELFDELQPLERQLSARDDNDVRRSAAAGLEYVDMVERSGINRATLEGWRDGQRSAANGVQD